ncbi:MAG: hypothetical protein HY862_06435 [Chloroflexi bacterium]|nr:hypothetical protein [Chloroflexota bacterium]
MKELTLEEIKNFVMVAHFDLEKVQTLLEADPRLLNVVNPDFDESALVSMPKEKSSKTPE